ncbi:MAG: hypothetical protein IJ806_07970 [Ruminococcus sp.]|nr:hypothetical protein [Ruminococcus sp.]
MEIRENKVPGLEPDPPKTEELIKEARRDITSTGRSLVIWNLIYAAAGFGLLWLYFHMKVQSIIFLTGTAIGVIAGAMIMFRSVHMRGLYGFYLLFGAFPMVGSLVWAVIWQGFGALDDNVKVSVATISWMLSVACNVVFLLFKLIAAGLFVSAFVKDRLVDYVTLFESRKTELYLKNKKGQLL